MSNARTENRASNESCPNYSTFFAKPFPKILNKYTMHRYQNPNKAGYVSVPLINFERASA